MGVYDTFGESGIQLKAGPCDMHYYKVGDKVDDEYQDGIYLDPFGGIVVIKNGVFVAEFNKIDGVIFDKWGGHIDLQKIAESNNPVAVALETLKK